MLPPLPPPPSLFFLQPAAASVATSAVESKTADPSELDSLIACLQRHRWGADHDTATVWRWRPGINSRMPRSRDRQPKYVAKCNAPENTTTAIAQLARRSAPGSAST